MPNNNDNTQYNGEDIRRYISGQMSAQEMHAIERAALEDPFLADAIEGFKETMDAGDLNLAPHLEELHLRLKKRVNNEEIRTRPVAVNWWRIAAVLILLAGCGTLAYRLLVNSQENRELQVAKNESKISPDTSREQYAAPKPFPKVDSTSIAFSRKTPEVKPPRTSPLKAKSSSGNPNTADQSDAVASQPLLMPRPDSSLTRSSEKDIASAPQISREFNKPAVVQKVTAMRSLGKEVPANFFSGKVVSEENEPVAGATVRVSGKNDMQFATDSNGNFNFALPDTIATVAVNAVGFETINTTINSSPTDSRIRLTENKNALNEVVVVGYGKKKTGKPSQNLASKSRDAEPEIGFTEYNKYIARNKKTDTSASRLHGDVVISFFVARDGSLSNLKVEKSISKSIDAEAIRLLKEGPAWKLLNNKKARVEFTIAF